MDYLKAAAFDKACAVCYHIYLVPFLSTSDGNRLLCTADDCGCDWAKDTAGHVARPDDPDCACASTSKTSTTDAIMKES